MCIFVYGGREQERERQLGIVNPRKDSHILAIITFPEKYKLPSEKKGNYIY